MTQANRNHRCCILMHVLAMALLADSCKTPSQNSPATNPTRNAAATVQEAAKNYLEAGQDDLKRDPAIVLAAQDAAGLRVDGNHPLNAADVAGVVASQVSHGVSDLKEEVAADNIARVSSECSKDSSQNSGGSGRSCLNPPNVNSGKQVAVALGAAGAVALLGAVGSYLGRDHFGWDADVKRWKVLVAEAKTVDQNRQALDNLMHSINQKEAQLLDLVSENPVTALRASTMELLKIDPNKIYTPTEQGILERLASGTILVDSEIEVFKEMFSSQESTYKQGESARLLKDGNGFATEPWFPTAQDFDKYFKADPQTLKKSELPESIRKIMKFSSKSQEVLSSTDHKIIIGLAEALDSSTDAVEKTIVKILAANPSQALQPKSWFETFSEAKKSFFAKFLGSAEDPIQNIADRISARGFASLSEKIEASPLPESNKAKLAELASLGGYQRSALNGILNSKDGGKKITADRENFFGRDQALKDLFSKYRTSSSKPIYTPEQKDFISNTVAKIVERKYQLKLERTGFARDKLLMNAMADYILHDLASPENAQHFQKNIELLSVEHRAAIENIAEGLKEADTKIAEGRKKLEASIEAKKQVEAYHKKIKMGSGGFGVIGIALISAAVGAAKASDATNLADNSSAACAKDSYIGKQGKALDAALINCLVTICHEYPKLACAKF